MSEWQTVVNWDAGYLAGIKVERDRIIKLLEGIAIETPMGEVAIMELLSAVTKLIKGEQK